MAVALKGRVAFVTGASRGIGAAIAVRLAEAGATLGLTARDREGLDRTESAAKTFGADCWTHIVDLASPAQIGGRMEVEELITDRFSLQRTLDAFELARCPRPGIGKIMIEF